MTDAQRPTEPTLPMLGQGSALPNGGAEPTPVLPAGTLDPSSYATTPATSEDTHDRLRTLRPLRSLRGVESTAELADQLQRWRRALTSNSARFQVDGVLGQGSQGTVFDVADRDCHRHIALKTMRSASHDPEAVSRFIHEAQVTAQLQHPGIVPVHDLGVLPDGTVFYAMKRVVGTTLSQHIRDGRFAYAHRDQRYDVLQLFLRVCETIAFAHDRGVVHRDLKPGNIMVGDYGEVLVLDWGLAKVLDDSITAAQRPYTPNTVRSIDQQIVGGADETMAGTAVGTPAYMSPEQACGGEAVDRSSDVYALGVILYELLTGLSPYVRGEARKTLEQVARGQWARLDAGGRGRGLPRALVAIVHKAMAYQQADRYQSAAALGDDLREHLAGRAVDAYQESPLEATARLLWRHRRGVLVILGMILVGATVAAVALLMNAQHRRDEITRLSSAAAAAERANDLEQARRDYERLQELDPVDAVASEALVRVRSRLRAAADVAEQQRQQERGHDLAATGAAAAATGNEADLRLAVEKYQGALALVPKDAQVLASYQDVVQRLATLDAARTARTAAEQTQRDRQHSAAELTIKAQADLDAGRADDALSHVQAALVLSPTTVPGELLRQAVATQDTAERERDRHRRQSEAEQLLSKAQSDAAALADLDARLRVRAGEREALALDLLDTSTDDRRRKLHAVEQELEQLERTRSNQLAGTVATLHQALALAPNHPPVRAALAAFFIARLRDAEARAPGAEASAEAVAAEAQARAFDDGAFAELLAGQARLAAKGTALTATPIVELDDRTLDPGGQPFAIAAGEERLLPRGRYQIASSGGSLCARRIARGSRVDLSLPAHADLPSGAVYVPAGQVFGADGRVLAEPKAFAIGAREVTCGDYLEFLNDAQIRARFDAALTDGNLILAPRAAFDATTPLWRRRGGFGQNGGDFQLIASGDGRSAIDPDAPVTGISVSDAESFARWKATRDRRPWRLPTLSEWRLAAQGGDGRLYPWGDRADLGLCRSAQSGAGERLSAPGRTAAFPRDRTVQGAFDFAGSVSEFVADSSTRDARFRLLAGGNCHDLQPERYTTLSLREVDPRFVHVACGFRLALEVE